MAAGGARIGLGRPVDTSRGSRWDAGATRLFVGEKTSQLARSACIFSLLASHSSQRLSSQLSWTLLSAAVSDEKQTAKSPTFRRQNNALLSPIYVLYPIKSAPGEHPFSVFP